MLDNESADTEYGMDGAEASMVTLVNGRLVPMGNTEDDVEDDQLMNRYSSDEERGLQGTSQKKYENSDAALNVDGPADMRQLNDTMAEADLTQDPAQADPNESGAPDATNQVNDQTQTFGWATTMVPTTPGTPEPYQPVPSTPAPIPPTPPMPGPEIPEIPNSPIPGVEEPSHPEQVPGINALITFTSGVPSGAPAGKGLYEGLTPGTDNEGMTDDPHTNESDRPYEPNTDTSADYESGELVSEAQQSESQPREGLDESLSKKEQMDGGSYPVDPAEEKSTEGLDRPYNDSQRW